MEKELLIKYALYLENPEKSDYDNSQLSDKEIAEIKEYLKRDKTTRHYVDTLRAEFRELVNCVDNVGFEGISTYPEKNILNLRQKSTYKKHLFQPFQSKTLYPLAAALLAGLFLVIFIRLEAVPVKIYL